MPSCRYCSDISPPAASAGTCQGSHPNGWVCTALQRTDGHHHGEYCACRCNGLFCLAHARQHAVSVEHSRFENCFPALAHAISGPALTGALSAVATGQLGYYVPDDTRRAVADFLQFVEPGEEALLALDTGPIRFELEESDWPVMRLNVPHELFTRSRLERVAALAARSLGRGAGGTESARGSRPFATALRSLAEWAVRHVSVTGADLRPLLESLAPDMAGTESSDLLARVLRDQRRDIPEDSAAVAAWLLERTEARETAGAGVS